MTNTQKLTTKQMIEESVEALIYLKDKMDLPAFIVALNVKFLKVAEAAKAERDKEILDKAEKRYGPFSSVSPDGKVILAHIKALLNNQKAK